MGVMARLSKDWRPAHAKDAVRVKGRNHQATVFADAHTHIQMFRRFGDSILINPGSVGFAWEMRGAQMMATPWAEYALLTVADGRLSVDLRSVPYDLAELRRVTLAMGMPHAERWLSQWTLGIRRGAYVEA
jgi:hypothetical protein